MAVPFTVERAVPYVFCADAGAISTWCQQVLGFVERGRWSDDDGAVSNVELTLGAAEVWLDGPVPDWPSGSRVLDLGSGSGSTIWTHPRPRSRTRCCCRATRRPRLRDPPPHRRGPGRTPMGPHRTHLTEPPQP
jgi:hypothetical protein